MRSVRMPNLNRIRSLFLVLAVVTLALPFNPGRVSASAWKPPQSPGVRAGQVAAAPDPAIAFERNTGQFDARADFVARAGDAALFLTRSGSVLAIGNEKATAAVRMSFVGGHSNPGMLGLGRLPGSVNHISGSDPALWLTAVDRFSSVSTADVYPGIDVLYHSASGGLEYDFIVAPGADPSTIVVEFDGADSVSISKDGDLVLETSVGELLQRRPVAYQDVNGSRRLISSAYVSLGADRIGFALGEYDHALPLVIDPKLTYSSFLGGSSPDRAFGIGLDAAGNTYVAGRTFSLDFPTVGGVQPVRAGDYDAYVTKFDVTGATMVYSTYFGGLGYDEALALAVTPSGEVVIGGDTDSGNFPAVAPFQPTLGGGIDGFIARLGTTGATVVYSSYCGGFTTETIEAVAIDSAGIASFGGKTNSDTTFPLVLPLQGTYGGGPFDGIYGRVSAGGALLNASYIGGLGTELVDAIAVDGAGNVYMTGLTQGLGFPTVTPFQMSGGGNDAFVTKVASDFLSLIYSSPLGGGLEDAGTGIAVDAAGNAYVTGYTKSTNFPTTNPFQPALDNNFDAFVTKVNAAGSGKVYSSYLGGDLEDRGRAIAVDATGSAVVVGQTRSVDFRVVSPSQPANGGNLLNDAFVSRVGATGRQLVYSTYLGGSQTDIGLAVTIDAARTAYVAGYTDSGNFPVLGAEQPTIGGVDDAFITRIAEPGDTPGLVYQGASPPAWFLRNAQNAGPADITVSYGPTDATWVPITGDWDGNGTDTPGLYNPATGTFFLRNSNTNGPANIVFSFGSPLIYRPIAGDWNGDGIDSVGIYNPSTGLYFLKNTNAAGPPDHGFTFGVGGGTFPVAGDWDGNGSDSVGFYDQGTGTWFLRNSLSNGPADLAFSYGPPGFVAITGDWNADGIDTPGVYDPGTGSWFLINTNASGPADVVFGYGGGGGTPIAGDWNG